MLCICLQISTSLQLLCMHTRNTMVCIEQMRTAKTSKLASVSQTRSKCASRRRRSDAIRGCRLSVLHGSQEWCNYTMLGKARHIMHTDLENANMQCEPQRTCICSAAHSYIDHKIAVHVISVMGSTTQDLFAKAQMPMKTAPDPILGDVMPAQQVASGKQEGSHVCWERCIGNVDVRREGSNHVCAACNATTQLSSGAS